MPRTGLDKPAYFIDYGISVGQKAYAVQGGAVSFDALGTVNAKIIIGNWRYVHMAEDTTKFQVYRINSISPGNPKADIVIFRRVEINGTTTTIKGLSTEAFDFYDSVTDSTIPVNNTVLQGDWVYMPRGNHLHLDYNADLENPLKYVLHSDSNTPVAALSPEIKRIGSNKLASKFPSNIIYNTAQPLLLEVGVDVTGDKDLDKVEMSVTAEGDSLPALSNRWEYEPAVNREPVYTTTGRAGRIFLNSSLSAIASTSQEGVYPAKDVVSSDTFKFKWNTRLANLSAPSLLLPAPLNSLSEYPDGRYIIKMGAMDITGHEIGGGDTKILDNYRPYAESVELKDSEGNTKYKRNWTYNNGVLVSPGAAVDEPLLAGTGYTASIAFSEYMDHGELRVGDTGSIYFLSGVQDPALKRTVYTGTFQIPVLQRDELRPLIITGVDFAGNNTLALAPGKRDGDGSIGFARTIDPSYELVRDDESIMRGVGGEDLFHPLRIDAASPEVSWPDRQGIFGDPCFDGTPERCGSEAAPVYITFNTVRFRYADIGSGLSSLKIHKDNPSGEVFKELTGLSSPTRAFAYEIELPIPDGKYAQVVTDNLGKACTQGDNIDIYDFRLDC